MKREIWESHLWQRVEKREDGHWIWHGSLTKSGVPVFSYCDLEKGVGHWGSRTVYKTIHEVVYGHIPPAPLIPKCGKSLCVNPEHMKNFEPSSINLERDAEIRKLWNLSKIHKTTMQKLGDKYGITRQRIEQILNHEDPKK